jgi:hypothetical protein
MICKHCGENVVKNTVKKSPAPFVYHPWKHAGTFIIGCFNAQGNPRGTKAEPKESR